MTSKWRIDYSKEAYKFIKKHDIEVDVKEGLKKFVFKTAGENVNLDLKKLGGDWKGYYRIRIGKIRMIFEINQKEMVLYVDRVDFRGDVYK